MTTFDDREKGFENKFAHDEELRFKATVRRNKLIGLWAAHEMGIDGDAAEAYAKEVIKADFEEKGDADVIRKLLKDFSAKGIEMTEHRIEVMLSEKMSEAMTQVMKEA